MLILMYGRKRKMPKRCCLCGRNVEEGEYIGLIANRVYCDNHPENRTLSWIPIDSGKAKEILNE
jgi:hypothetical protein